MQSVKNILMLNDAADGNGDGWRLAVPRDDDELHKKAAGFVRRHEEWIREHEEVVREFLRSLGAERVEEASRLAAIV